VKDHDVEMSILEAAFARGDEKLAPLIEKAWSFGCRFDGWAEVFDFGKWKKAMDLTGIDGEEFARKNYERLDNLPWENIDVRVTKDFLWKEKQKALEGHFTPDCMRNCQNCGLECKDSNKLQVASIDYELGTPNSNPPLPTFSKGGRGEIIKRFKPVRIRVEFLKTGRLRYLSHLELMSVLYRAIRRAGFPLEYTEGYHPSLKVSFGPPLGVGIGGLSEYFDMEVIPPFDIVGNRRKLNNILPEGIYAKDMAAISPRAKSLSSFITRYGYEIKGRNLSNMDGFLSEKEVTAQRGKHVINLRAMVEEARKIDEGTIYLLLVDQGEVKIRLGELLPKVFNVPLKELEITRVALYGWNAGWVNPLERSSQWTAKS
jgi:radical SAM-linked protein